jgi:hypothetical protein
MLLDLLMAVALYTIKKLFDNKKNKKPFKSERFFYIVNREMSIKNGRIKLKLH